MDSKYTEHNLDHRIFDKHNYNYYRNMVNFSYPMFKEQSNALFPIVVLDSAYFESVIQLFFHIE